MLGLITVQFWRLPWKQLLQQQRKGHWLHWLQQQRQLRCLQFQLFLEFRKVRSQEIGWRVMLGLITVQFWRLPWKQLLQQQRKGHWLHWLQQQRQLRCLQFQLFLEFRKVLRQVRRRRMVLGFVTVQFWRLPNTLL